MSLAGKLWLSLSGFSFIVMAVSGWILAEWYAFLYIFLALCFIGLAMAIIMDWRFYLGFLTMRTTAKGMSMGASILLTLVLCVSLAYLSVRFEKSFDITEEKINSLAPQTVQLLGKLEGDLDVRVFYKGGAGLAGKASVKQVLSLFKRASFRVKDHYYNAHLRNVLAQEYLSNLSNVSRDTIFVFMEYKGKRVQVEAPYDEEKLNSAIIQVTRRGERVVYFLTGHGEKEIDTSLSALQEALEQSSFQVKTWSFVKDGFAVPKDASVVVVVGPRKLVLKKELELLKDYISGGGRVFLALDPAESVNRGGSVQAGAKEHVSFSDLSLAFGVKYTGYYALSKKPAVIGLGPLAMLAMNFDYQHAITRSFDTNSYVIFHGVSPLEVVGVGEKYSITELVKTDVKTVSVSSLTKDAKVSGTAGPYIIGLLVQVNKEDKAKGGGDKAKDDVVDQSSKGQGALAIFGDSHFMANEFFHTSVGWNRDLIMNTLSWLVDDQELIGIRPKKLKSTQLVLKYFDKQLVVFYSIILPCVFFIMSAVIWFRRRGA